MFSCVSYSFIIQANNNSIYVLILSNRRNNAYNIYERSFAVSYNISFENKQVKL